MLEFLLGHVEDRPLRVLCLGAHSDDIEIGCGGTIAWLLNRYANVHVRWVVLSAHANRAAEARASADAFLSGAAQSEVFVHAFRDGYFPFVGASIKDEFEQIKSGFSPDVVFTHQREDRHQDHRIVSDLTWNTFRNHLILEYEIPKYDGDLGQPNLFVPLTETICAVKVERLLTCFPTQRAKPWFDEATFLALLRLRGMEANAPSRMAEAFYARKLWLQ